MSQYDEELQGTYYPGNSVFWKMNVGEKVSFTGLAKGDYPPQTEFTCADALLGFKGGYQTTVTRDRVLLITRVR